MAFALTCSENIIIYGVGEQGKKFIRIFRDKGFHVKAVLDKRADELQQIIVDEYIVQVVDPDEYVINSSDEIVIISLWNAVRHEQIARHLHERGFEKIIYLPMSATGNYKLMAAMRCIYNEILDENVYLEDVPHYSDMVKKTRINVRNDICYLPIELLFSEEDFEVSIQELSHSDYLKRINVLKSAGENLINFKAYYQMYRYLDCAEGDCEDYLHMQIDETAPDFEEQSRRILKDRFELFQIYESVFELDRDFFIDSAPKVKWNQKGYFNIVDGHHRVSYLFHKGIWNIPVRIAKEDQERLDMLGNISDDYLCESLSLVYRRDALSWRKQNAIICSSLLKKDVSERKIYVNMHDAGYIARYCCRVGCAQCIDMESEDRVAFAKRLRELFQYCDRLMIEESIKEHIDVDIAIIDEAYLTWEKVHAGLYIIKLEKNGSLYNQIMQRGIKYRNLGAVFDGERRHLIIQISGGSLCSL